MPHAAPNQAPADPAMTCDEYNTILHRIGLSPPWVATQCGRPGATGWYWGAGRTAIPEPVAVWLRALHAAFVAHPPPKLPKYRPKPPGRSPRAA